MVETIRILRQEHADLEKLLYILERRLRMYGKWGHIRHGLMHEILDYFRGYPALCHHQKEDLVYRKLLALGDAGVREALGDLPLEHEDLVQLTGEFEAAVHGLPPDRRVSRESFLQVARNFVDRYRRHMEMEERVFFPAALRSLSTEDWAEIDRQAVAGKDPLFGPAIEPRFEALRKEIHALHLADWLERTET